MTLTFMLKNIPDRTPPCLTPLHTLNSDEKQFVHRILTESREYQLTIMLTKHFGRPCLISVEKRVK